MKNKNQNKRPSLEDLFPDKEKREEVVRRLYNGDAIVGRDGIFTDLLQALINASLEGEMRAHLGDSKA
jgi:putative transposase